MEDLAFASLYVVDCLALGHGNCEIRKGNVIGAKERFQHVVYDFVPHVVFKCRCWSDRQLSDVWRLNKLSREMHRCKTSSIRRLV